VRGRRSGADGGIIMKSSVIVMGYNVNEPNYEEVVWGEPPHRPGRLVKGAAIFLEEDAEIFFLTGCGGRDGREGVEITRDLLYERIKYLEEFTVCPIFRMYHHSIILDRLEQAIRLEHRHPDKLIQTTLLTMRSIKLELVISETQKVTLVSSPDHISRCLRDALVCWEGTSLALNLSAVPSATLYSLRSEKDADIAKMENVLVLEPPLFSSSGKLIRKLLERRDDKELLKKIDAVLKEGA
jgi:hypothetical protein